MIKLFGVLKAGSGLGMERDAPELASCPFGDRDLPCVAPGLARADGLVVALRGRPFWEGGAERAADAAFSQEIHGAFRSEGPGFLRRLHGSFAVAIVDCRAQRALLAIDRMGIERLAYSRRSDSLVFSTSAEDVARYAGVTPRIDNQALYSYLFFHMVPAPATVFEGVYKLAPASMLELDGEQLRISKYWNPVFAESGGGDFDNLSQELHASLRKAVRAARPGPSSGAFLSGGLDSSTVTGILSEVGPRPAKTFSIGFGYPDYDELAYARIANKHFKCRGYEYIVHGRDIAQSLPAIARTYDEPFGNSSALPAYYCARLAKAEGVDHLLAGDGGDELFAGNSRYAENEIFEWYQLAPRFVRGAMLEPVLASLPLDIWPIRKARGYVAQASIPLPVRLESWNFVSRLGAAEILHPDFLRAIDLRGPLVHMQQLWDAAPCRSSLNRMLHYDWHITLADNDLRKVQTMCELAGVSVSYPMLHPDVVETANRVPPNLKMRGRKLRHFYKRAMRGLLPDQIIHKKKHGFGLPFGLWLQESLELRDLIFGNLSKLRSRGIVREAFVDHLQSLHGTDDPRYYGVFVWVLAMLDQWFTEHHVAP